MKKLLYFGFILSCLALNANAAVTFLPQAKNSVGNYHKTDTTPSDQKCKNAGYTQTQCTSSQKKIDICPYNKSYFKYCCEADYKFTKQECLNAGLSYSRKSCGGLHKCL